MIKYRITVYGIKEERNKAEDILLGDCFPGVTVSPLVEDGVYSIYKKGKFTEDELLILTKRLAEKVPDCEIFTDVIDYDHETTAKTVVYQVKYESKTIVCKENPYQ